MDNKLIINKRNASEFGMQLLLVPETDKSPSDIRFDRSIYTSDDDLEMLAYIGRKEYEMEIGYSFDMGSDERATLVSADLKYCHPNNVPENGAEVYQQEPGKVLHWSVLLTATKEELPCTVELFAYYRDTMGNVEILHPASNEWDIDIPTGRGDVYLEMDISNENGQPLPCGRYYTAMRITNRRTLAEIDTPMLFMLNIVPAKAEIKPVTTNLIGMEPVLEQMNQLVKQRIFNDHRRAMNLPGTPINLHAAVMGNKGTGKTAFAKTLYDFYIKNGFIHGPLKVIEGNQWVRQLDDASVVEADMRLATDGMLYIENAASMIATDSRSNRDFAPQALARYLKENESNTSLVLSDTPENITRLLATAGLKDFIGQTYQLPTLDVDQMMAVAERDCKERGFILSEQAAAALKAYIMSQPNSTATDVTQLIDETVMNMSMRVVNNSEEISDDPDMLSRILPEDIPQPQVGQYDRSMSKLNNLVGLKKLKYNIESHLNLVRFAQLRSRNGLQATMPPLHMIFTGNPGTGKTTVANLLGEIYASLGILKTGKVIQVDRKKLVGQYIGDTEDNTKKALQQAHGNILFIDEAYTLVGDPDDKRDFGPKVLDCLLEELSKESTDMIIIMAGYPDEMEKMLKSNKGLKSRFPYTFHFEDYTEEELLQIAIVTAKQSGYVFSDEALQRLSALIHKEVERSSGHTQKHFGNARFITRLISTKIIQNMSRRVLGTTAETTPQRLSRIESTDIPTNVEDTEYTIDEVLVTRTLQQLDEMAGLKDVKRTLHNLVNLARSRQQSGEDLSELIPMQWTFTGSTGTGKSSVAKLLAQLLHAFHLISSDRMVQLRMPQTNANAWTPYEVDKLLRDTMQQAGQGMLFIDLDDVANSHMDIQWLRCKLTSLTAEMPGSYAFVIAVDDTQLATHAIEMPISTSVIHFEDYTADELMEILRQRLNKHGFCLSDEAAKEVFGHIKALCDNRSSGFANARTIKHIYTAITSAAELRLMQSGLTSTPMQITKEDIQSFPWNPLRTNSIGFH